MLYLYPLKVCACVQPLMFFLDWCGLSLISDSVVSNVTVKAGKMQKSGAKDRNISQSSIDGMRNRLSYRQKSRQRYNYPYSYNVLTLFHFNDSIFPKTSSKMPGFADTILYSPTHPIVLRNPKPSDASVLSRILSNPENIKNDPMCSPTGFSEEQSSKFIARSLESASKEIPTSVSLVLVLLPSISSSEEGEVIGLGGFGGIDEEDGKRFGDVGIMVEPEFRGRGYALEALRLSIEFALEKLGVDGVSAATLEMNEPMVTLLERKMGWAGERRDSKWGVECLYKMYPADWEAMKRRMGWS